MKNGWRIVSSAPILIYQQEINGLRNSTLLFSIALLIVSVLCAFGLSISVAQPIRRLSSAIARFGDGDFSIRCPEITDDETGKLSATFNQMADKINLLVQKVFDEQQMKREAELKSLLMQIQPHFLYNTLETINWMARTHGTNDIGIIAKSLGDLMRASINGKDHILLKDEVINLTNYLKIQKYRYGDKFRAKVEIEPATENLYIPKLIIQPLLENAIYHGIEPAFINGSIEVRSFSENEYLLVTVTDNGIGMTNEIIESVLDINNGIDLSVTGTIGLKNVIKRIKTLFGNNYGVEIQSELGEGTKITLRLPAIATPSVSVTGPK
jgi:two-component system sensor histidine kinase YesM